MQFSIKKIQKSKIAFKNKNNDNGFKFKNDNDPTSVFICYCPTPGSFRYKSYQVLSDMHIGSILFVSNENKKSI